MQAVRSACTKPSATSCCARATSPRSASSTARSRGRVRPRAPNRSGRWREPVDGPSRHDQYFIWAGGVIVPALILFFVAFLTVHTGAALRNPSRNPLAVRVVANQWWWAVSYPGTNVVTGNEIHLPVG